MEETAIKGMAKKPRAEMSVKQKKFVDGIRKGKTKKQAALDAGYSQKYPRQAADQALKGIQTSFRLAAFELGITPKSYIDKYVLDGCFAETVDRSQHQGVFMEEKIDPDWGNRHRFRRMLGELMGAFDKEEGDAGSQVQSRAHTVCVVVSDKRAAEAMARLLSPSGSAGVVIDVDAEVD